MTQTDGCTELWRSTERNFAKFEFGSSDSATTRDRNDDVF